MGYHGLGMSWDRHASEELNETEMSAMSAHFRPPDGECWLRIKHSLWAMTLTPLFASWLRTNDFQTIDHIEVDGILLEPIAGEKKMLNYSDCGRDLLDSSGWFLPPEWGTDGLYKGLILGINVWLGRWTVWRYVNINLLEHWQHWYLIRRSLCLCALSNWSCVVGVDCVNNVPWLEPFPRRRRGNPIVVRTMDFRYNAKLEQAWRHNSMTARVWGASPGLSNREIFSRTSTATHGHMINCQGEVFANQRHRNWDCGWTEHITHISRSFIGFDLSRLTLKLHKMMCSFKTQGGIVMA